MELSDRRGKHEFTYTEEGIVTNVELTVEGHVLTLRIDLSKEIGPSNSGKTILIATSGGPARVPGRTERIGINVYRPR